MQNPSSGEHTAALAFLCAITLGVVVPSLADGPASNDDPSPPWDRQVLAEGLVVESIPASIPSTANAGDGTITLVRIDPARYRFRLLTAESHGARTAPRWSRDFGLTGVINASMFQVGGRSTGLMVQGTKVNNGYVNPSFGAFLAFDPTSPGVGPVRLFGRGCPGFDLEQIRDRYDVVIQNYRMLDCASRAIPWKDSKIYSVAAVGVDRDGWVVFIHSRTPYRMRDFNTMIADPRIGLTAAMFVEGGPEASLFVRTDNGTIERKGSWETGFLPTDSNARFWSIPNVIGFSPREADPVDGGESALDPSR